MEGGQRLFYCFCSGVAASQMVWRAVLPAKIREKQCMQPEEQIYVRQVDCTLRSTFSMWPRFPSRCNLSSSTLSRSRCFSQTRENRSFASGERDIIQPLLPYSRKLLSSHPVTFSPVSSLIRLPSTWLPCKSNRSGQLILFNTMLQVSTTLFFKLNVMLIHKAFANGPDRNVLLHSFDSG